LNGKTLRIYIWYISGIIRSKEKILDNGFVIGSKYWKNVR
jgi:hypothetical protein